jgi:hypothetical protein
MYIFNCPTAPDIQIFTYSIMWKLKYSGFNLKDLKLEIPWDFRQPQMKFRIKLNVEQISCQMNRVVGIEVYL